MSNKKIKLKSVDRNVRRNTRAKRSKPPVKVKKQGADVKRIDNIKVELTREERLEEAKKNNVVVLSTPVKKNEPAKIREEKVAVPPKAEEKAAPAPAVKVEKKEEEKKSRKTIKDPLWYIGSGVLWLFDTLRGHTGIATEEVAPTEEEEEDAEDEVVAGEEIIAEEEAVAEVEEAVTVVLEDESPEPEMDEEAPAEEALVEEAPVEEVPVEEALVEETPVEEAPVEEAPIEEVPVEEALVEEAPVEDAPVEETSVEEAPVEEVPAEEVPVEETPVEEEMPLEESSDEADGEEDEEDEEEDDEDEEDEDDEDESGEIETPIGGDDGNGFVLIAPKPKKERGFSLATITRYAKTTAAGADRRIKENAKLERKLQVLRNRVEKTRVPRNASEEQEKAVLDAKAGMEAQIAEIEKRIAINSIMAVSLEKAADEYAYVRRYVDGTVLNYRKTERLGEVEITVKQSYLDDIVKKYNAAHKAK